MKQCLAGRAFFKPEQGGYYHIKGNVTYEGKPTETREISFTAIKPVVSNGNSTESIAPITSTDNVEAATGRSGSSLHASTMRDVLRTPPVRNARPGSLLGQDARDPGLARRRVKGRRRGSTRDNPDEASLAGHAAAHLRS